MKEHHRTDRLTLITILLVLVVGALLITYRAPKFDIELSPAELLSEVRQLDYILPVQEAETLLEDENTVFVDLRNQGEFVVQRIKGAINIPLPQILDEESIQLFEDEDKTFVLYGNDHRDANGAWMLLRELGYENFRVLLGGYQNFMTDSLTFPYHFKDFARLTQAEFDLQDEIEKRAKEIASSDAAKVKSAASGIATPSIRTKKKVTAAPVLPPPPQNEEEEEEGC